ncbi:Ornithine decarboxylase [Blattella germanica]|nr:Ornithine decarboxylase [Blattella germanica]
MKLTNLDERIHVLDADVDVWKVIRDIAESGVQEEPFYVCDVGDIVRKHKEWKQKLPRVEPFYAVKCNDNLTVLEVLAALGTGFDCASKAEIMKVMEIGVDPDRIIFANPTKPASHIRHAAALGVDVMTFDNETELHKIQSLFPSAKLVIRIRCDAAVAQCQLGMKFGCDANTEAPRLLKIAQSLRLDVIGVSFHVGSGCGDPPAFRRAISAAKMLFDLAENYGFNFHLLDIGGGYPGNKSASINKIADVVNCALDEYFPDPELVRVIAEPGRYYVASAFTLATNIHSKREIPIGEEVTNVMYYINDGVYGSFNSLLYDHAQVTPIPLNNHCGKLLPSSVWGPTCDGLDQVVEKSLLPLLSIGEWIIFEDMGAYTLPVASPFNGFPVPKVHIVADESIWCMLKDMLPLSEDNFVMGSTPNNLRLGLDIGGNSDVQEWAIPISPRPALCHQEMGIDSGSPLKEAVMDHSSPPASAFHFDFVEVGPIN